jgi:MSHA biogenesis protein MshL
MSGYHYTVRGNILHVKSFVQKMFVVPYIQSLTTMNTQLGGDMLNSAQSGGESGGGEEGIRGELSLKFGNAEKMNSFYQQLEDNIKALLSSEGRYTLNRASGVISVYDKKDRVDVVESIINQIKQRSQRQVLIEAKILEVVLNDDHNLGVSWEAIAEEVVRSGDQLMFQQTLGLEGTVAGTVSYSAKNFNAIINALNASGDIDTLSNPRIKVLSGQSAMISSGKLVPFWEKEVQTAGVTTTTNGQALPLQEVTYNRRDVLNGITMGVTPVIMDDGRIMLNVVPITSSIDEVIEHFDENGNSVASGPILNIKEAGTVIYANDNDLVSIGGLINNTISKQQEKIPGLGDLPGLGQFFTKTTNTDEKRELVILLKLTVVD